MCFGIWLRGFRRTTPLDLLSVLVHFHPLFRPRVSPVHEKSSLLFFFFFRSSSFTSSSSSSLDVYVHHRLKVGENKKHIFDKSLLLLLQRFSFKRLLRGNKNRKSPILLRTMKPLLFFTVFLSTRERETKPPRIPSILHDLNEKEKWKERETKKKQEDEKKSI